MKKYLVNLKQIFRNPNGTVRDATFDDIFGHYSLSANSDEPLLIEQNARKDPVRVIDTSLMIDYSLDLLPPIRTIHLNDFRFTLKQVGRGSLSNSKPIVSVDCQP